MARRCHPSLLLFGVNMLRKILVFMMLAVGGVCAYAQTGAIEGYCNRGGQSATVSGLNSTNKFQNVINSCTISVYQTGTNTLVPGNQIFSNSTGTVLGNPFTADNATSLTPGKWLFFISTTTAVDVYGSGGIAPNTYAVPVPLCVDCYASSQFAVTAGVTEVDTDNTSGVTGGPITSTGTIHCAQSSPTQLGCAEPDGTSIIATGGVLSVVAGSNLTMVSTPPISGQYVVVYPGTVASSYSSQGYATAGATGGELGTGNLIAPLQRKWLLVDHMVESAASFLRHPRKHHRDLRVRRFWYLERSPAHRNGGALRWRQRPPLDIQ